MTVIAWDGTSLAADRACNIGGVFFESTKVRRHDGAVFALAGDGTRLEQLMAWYRAGADPEKYPPRAKEDEGSVLVVIDVVTDRPRVRRFEATGYPMLLDGELYADGAGRDVALAALHCGKDAREAVLLACKLTAYCGNGVDVLPLYADGICSRCEKIIKHFRPPSADGTTAGYYDVQNCGGWAKYANPDEVYVCDACMWADPTYIIDHGQQT